MIVMALVAHPTDAFDMVGGTLANHVDAGDEVYVCFMHSRVHEDAFRLADDIRAGKKKQNAAAVAEESETHIKRTREACALLGIKNVATIDYDGDVMTVSPALLNRTADRIQQIRPDLLITHNPLENAGVTPHAVCGQVTLEAMRLAHGARNKGGTPHRTAQLYFICCPGQTCWTDYMATNRFPAVQIDVTEHVEKKVKALSLLEAQHYTPQMAAKLVEATSGLAAVHTRVAYAEHFQPYFPETYRTLPVSDYNLRLAKETYREGADRLRLIAPYIDSVRSAPATGTTEAG
mgnify:CR=1 FL=1